VRKIPVLRTVALLTHHLVDIKGDNILQEIEDKSILEAFTKTEMEHPSPRKFVKDAPVYNFTTVRTAEDIWQSRTERFRFGCLWRSEEKSRRTAQCLQVAGGDAKDRVELSH
jgi:hypothetical protein